MSIDTGKDKKKVRVCREVVGIRGKALQWVYAARETQTKYVGEGEREKG